MHIYLLEVLPQFFSIFNNKIFKKWPKVQRPHWANTLKYIIAEWIRHHLNRTGLGGPKVGGPNSGSGPTRPLRFVQHFWDRPGRVPGGQSSSYHASIRCACSANQMLQSTYIKRMLLRLMIEITQSSDGEYIDAE